MAERLNGIPFDANEIILPDGSAGYDNVLYAEDFAKWLRTYFKNGVLVPGGALITDELKVTQVDATHVRIDRGNMVVNGRTTFIEEPKTLEISKAGVGLERKDRVVIELNLVSTVNSFRMLVIEGTMSASPVPVDLVRTDEIYQMSLATITVAKDGIVQITDDRPTDELCGISQVLIGVKPALPVTGDEASNIAYDNIYTGIEAATVQDAIDETYKLANTPAATDLQFVLKSADWSEDKTQTIIDLHFSEEMSRPIVDIVANTREEEKEWGKIWRATVFNGGITFYCSSTPSIDLNIVIKVVK